MNLVSYLTYSLLGFLIIISLHIGISKGIIKSAFLLICNLIAAVGSFFLSKLIAPNLSGLVSPMISDIFTQQYSQYPEASVFNEPALTAIYDMFGRTITVICLYFVLYLLIYLLLAIPSGIIYRKRIRPSLPALDTHKKVLSRVFAALTSLISACVAFFALIFPFCGTSHMLSKDRIPSINYAYEPVVQEYYYLFGNTTLDHFGNAGGYFLFDELTSYYDEENHEIHPDQEIPDLISLVYFMQDYSYYKEQKLPGCQDTLNKIVSACDDSVLAYPAVRTISLSATSKWKNNDTFLGYIPKKPLYPYSVIYETFYTDVSEMNFEAFPLAFEQMTDLIILTKDYKISDEMTADDFLTLASDEDFLLDLFTKTADCEALEDLVPVTLYTLTDQTLTAIGLEPHLSLDSFRKVKLSKDNIPTEARIFAGFFKTVKTIKDVNTTESYINMSFNQIRELAAALSSFYDSGYMASYVSEYLMKIIANFKVTSSLGGSITEIGQEILSEITSFLR